VKTHSASALAAALLWTAACGRAAIPAPPISAAQEHHPPHGGALVGLGDFAQVELVLDGNAGSVTAYILDGEAEESVRLKQSSLLLAIDTAGSGAPQVLELSARTDILTGETVGDSSEFYGTSQSLVGMKNIRGRIVDVRVKGQDFRDVRF
jgi:hypothetical protein